jgi:membrane protein DedA with SNARE-associated domain
VTAGLHPVATGVVAFAGNVLSVLLIVFFQQRLLDWWRRRRGQAESGGRYARARRLWDRYGVPVVGFAGLVLTGVHVAALGALAGGTRPRPFALWMTTGIAVWVILLLVGSVLGLSAIGSF